MFHQHETECNGHVSVHGNCNIERLTSRAFTFVHKCREQAHFSMLLSNTFSGISKLEPKESRLLHLYLRREESRNSGITICSFKLNVTHNWVWSNYHGTQQQLHARRDDQTEISSLPCQQNVITIPVSELYRHWFLRQNFTISDILLMSWCHVTVKQPILDS